MRRAFTIIDIAYAASTRDIRPHAGEQPASPSARLCALAVSSAIKIAKYAVTINRVKMPPAQFIARPLNAGNGPILHDV